jgi:hypothetical protein
MRTRVPLLVVSLTVAFLAGSAIPAIAAPTPTPTQAQAQGQTQAKPTTPPATQSADLPVDVDRIRQSLARPQAISLDGEKIRFYLEIHPPPVTFMKLVGHFDLMNGPVPYATMTGREFMDMTTPKEMYSEAGIKTTDMLQFALTNVAAQGLIRLAAQEIKKARERNDEKQVAEIRARIDRELAALMGKGGS